MAERRFDGAPETQLPVPRNVDISNSAFAGRGCGRRTLPWLSTVPALLLGSLWLLLALVKMLAPTFFIAYLGSMFGIPRTAALLLAWTAILAELMLGAWILMSFRRGYTVSAGISLVLSVSILGFLFIAGSQGPPCGCFGSRIAAAYSGRIAVAATLAFLSISWWRELAPRTGVLGGKV